MDETLPLDTDAQDAEMQASIDAWIAETKALREDMRRRDAAIEETRKETRAVLDEIAAALAELKAA